MPSSPSHQSTRAASTVEEFCRDHRISRSKLYDLWHTGTGPRVMKIGTKNLITNEAAAEWRASLEAVPAHGSES